MKSMWLMASVALLAGCNISIEQADNGSSSTTNVGGSAAASVADPNSFLFEDVDERPNPEKTPNPLMRAQVLLDRSGFSPGVIDGKEGQSFTLALRGFQIAHDLPDTSKLDQATIKALEKWPDMKATRLVRIPAGFAKGPFFPALPKEAAEQAKLPALGYRNLIEALAERFHTTPETLIALNGPKAQIGANQVIRVPNVPNIDPASLGEDVRGWNRTLETLAVAPDQPDVAKVVVDKSEGVLRAYDSDEKLVAQFPATMGSSHDPLPIGTWKIKGVSKNPEFHYNPKLFWDVSDNKEAQLLPPGPNGSVGVVWIDLSKPHYGIHGTPEPHTIGRAESHGCVRLTNWDAARLAQMVKPGIPAIFQN